MIGQFATEYNELRGTDNESLSFATLQPMPTLRKRSDNKPVPFWLREDFFRADKGAKKAIGETDGEPMPMEPTAAGR